MTATEDRDVLLTPRAAAARLGVVPKTLSRWARLGKVACVRTPGGHRRFRPADLEALMVEEHAP